MFYGKKFGFPAICKVHRMPKIKRSKRISLDTETTGLDLYHGAMPFLVTIAYKDQEPDYWEWEVNPRTREVEIPGGDLLEIQRVVSEADEIVLQNARFDVVALTMAFNKVLCRAFQWDWSKVQDTLIAGHLLASNQPHDLTSMAIVYLGVNIFPYEEALKAATREARSRVEEDLEEFGKRSPFHRWRLAGKGLAEMPSTEVGKGKNDVLGFDSWLPKAVAVSLRLQPDHPWHTVLADYANCDSVTTLSLFKAQERRIRKEGLWAVYRKRIEAIPVVYRMEKRGVTVHATKLFELENRFSEESRDMAGRCLSIASELGYDLTLPKAGNNKSLVDFVFGPLGMQPSKLSKKTKKPSLDKEVLDRWELSLPPGGPLDFIKNLRGKRKRDTTVTALQNYRRFWIPIGSDSSSMSPEWFVLHPSLNLTGTDTLRCSMDRPNAQNVSKQEGFNVRECFGPAPGREWWSLDARNIELRIPAYEAGEEEMVWLFEHEEEPPYYGSYHMLIFDTLHPDKFKEHGADCKKVYAATWYQWTKNGNFAVQYGAVEQSGTADAAYHVKGAQQMIKDRFRRVAALGEQQIAFAEAKGYVETIPDRSIDSLRGYPLLCTRTRRGNILPTVPLNYHVQGTAMWWMMKAMIRCQEYLDEVNRNHGCEDYFLVLQIHDELLFDFPAGKGKKPWLRNLPIIRKIRRIMESGGDDIGIPTPVGCEYHSETWASSYSIN